MTDCIQRTFAVQDLGKRKVVADFQGGNVSADCGVLLLSDIDKRSGMIDQLAACFTDHRRQELIEHTLPELLRQRILGMAMVCEDLNDHDTLRRDPMMALGVGKSDPLGLPGARIILRADSGFARDPIFSWCEQNKVFYVVGLGQNQVLLRHLDKTMFRAKADACMRGGWCTYFFDFQYRTAKTWSRSRRVVGKAKSIPRARTLVSS